ncbi:MAG: glucose-1-phosphate cytidylyltransferase [Pseudomonadota bacterium]
MKTVILCGGKGSRIRDIANEVPKPMLNIGERPILWHIMKIFSHYRNIDFLLCLGFKGWVIKEFFLNYKAMTSDLTIELGKSPSPKYHDEHPEGDWKISLVETGLETQTGHRLFQAKKYLGNESFLFTYGDGVANIDIDALVRFHRSHGKIGTMTGVRPPSRFGEIQLDGNKAVAFAEKPQTSSGLINGGFCLFEPEIFDYIPDDPSSVFEQTPLQRLAADGQLMVYQHNGFWQPMDTPREYELLNRLWNQGKAPWKVW